MRISLLLTIFAVFMVSACGPITYVPDPNRNPFEPITEFQSNNQLALKNNQPSTRPVIVLDALRDWTGDLQAWTDAAIQITTRELSKRGMTITDGAEKSLALKVVSARTTPGTWAVETVITMEVTRADGRKNRYQGRNKSGFSANIPRQIDGALMRAVNAMLNDQDLVAHITE
ncbi:MAG: hypothetical protein AAF557_19450 [Pseudomonadota bacterium]